MAYNLQSLITILQQFLNPQLQSLLEKSVTLQQILEKSSLSNTEGLESEIRDAAHKAEDIIESHVADQMLSNPEAVRFTFPTPVLQQVMQELDSVMEQVAKLIELEKTMSSGSSSSGASVPHDLSSMSIVDVQHPVQSKAVVGVDEALLQLKDQLTTDERKLEIVPIVGMGGIGKTTLARQLYQDPSIVSHFKYRAWSTVSQDYNMQAILLNLLGCIIGKECGQHVEKESTELKDILYRSMYGRRYVIVLDDVWSIDFWDETRMYFPDNNNGSRILITTRESEVAKHAGSQSVQHQMQLLSESASWDLLSQTAFGEEHCPDSLQGVGKRIASDCGGLPLAICVIGGLLSKANMSEDVWENVANDVRAAIVESDGQRKFSDILSLSYNHLPSHLRPCFLYMGAFPEDYEIKASRLIRLLVAEGFLKSKVEKDLEEEAGDCLKALVDRNLVSVREVKSNGRPKSYDMHDLMRDLCLKKAEEQRFVHVTKEEGGFGEVECIRRLSIHPSHINHLYASESMSLARSFLCTGSTQHRIPSPVLLALRLLRVLDILEIEFKELPREILQIVNLRYLAFSCAENGLPAEISRLCNLQTLVISTSHRAFYLPWEILQVAELRHVKVFGGTILFHGNDWGGFVLDKLQTIFSIGLSHEFLHRIPNVKKLGIRSTFSVVDLDHLHKVESLRFSCSFNSYGNFQLPVLTLPRSLKKLSLISFEIVGYFMNYLSELPNLEVLKLIYCQFKGVEPLEWDATQQEFCKLQFLLLYRVELVKWEADETNFPRLRRLVIQRCPALEEIPSGIGEIPTLQTIELDECSPSLVDSAKLVIKEQRENGNEELQLRV